MKTPLHYYLLCALLVVSISASAKVLNPKFQLLPQPRQIEVKSDAGIRWSDLTYLDARSTSIPVVGSLLDALPRHQGSGIGVTLRISDTGTPESKQGYTLSVTKKGVVISSRGQAGLFYGCATLEQLMQDSRDCHAVIPAMDITDYPAIPFRAVYFDTKHHLDRMDYYYRVIDKLAAYKINAVIWEVEDKLRYSRHPECSAPNAISKQEMQALCRYANERHIEINPLIQGLGHAGFILKHHWELRENPASDWEFCPSDPRTYELQFDLYRDALEAMPYGKYLHVGGDEITAIGIDERCKATGKSPFELQMIWLKKVCDFAVANGRTPIFWDDMPLKHADLWWVLHGGLSDAEVEKLWSTEKLDRAIDLFPKNCVYMRWHYEDPTTLPHLKILEWYKHAGLQVMAATSASDGGCPFMPRDDSRAKNIQNFSSLVVENNLTGILATAWDDGSPHWETVMRGFIAQGEYGWNPRGRSVVAFKTAHAQREFGFTAGQQDFLDELERAAFFFDQALVVQGRRNPAWQIDKFCLMALPDKRHPGTWSEKFAGRIDTARIEHTRYLHIKQGIAQAEQQALRNRYTLEIYQQNNELFHFPVQLLLALSTYDKAPDAIARKQAETDIQNIRKGFNTTRRNLEAVYSKTRFMQSPEGYISDMNHHHHLSALTPGSDWLYLYELPMIEQVASWLEAE